MRLRDYLFIFTVSMSVALNLILIFVVSGLAVKLHNISNAMTAVEMLEEITLETNGKCGLEPMNWRCRFTTMPTTRMGETQVVVSPSRVWVNPVEEAEGAKIGDMDTPVSFLWVQTKGGGHFLPGVDTWTSSSNPGSSPRALPGFRD
ncbi:MAG: hypothetical protein ABIA83_00330 [Patescibacteria group bacterium]